MHGVKSYKFEYKLGTETDYKLGKEITSSKNSCSYTYIDLTQEVVNNLKVIATDSLGNTKEATFDVTPDTPSPMNPTLTDISLAGKIVNYTPKANKMYEVPREYSGYTSYQTFTSGEENEDKFGTNPWRIWGESDDYFYVVAQYGSGSQKLYLKGVLRF